MTGGVLPLTQGAQHHRLHEGMAGGVLPLRQGVQYPRLHEGMAGGGVLPLWPGAQSTFSSP